MSNFLVYQRGVQSWKDPDPALFVYSPKSCKNRVIEPGLELQFSNQSGLLPSVPQSVTLCVRTGEIWGHCPSRRDKFMVLKDMDLEHWTTWARISTLPTTS